MRSKAPRNENSKTLMDKNLVAFAMLCVCQADKDTAYEGDRLRKKFLEYHPELRSKSYTAEVDSVRRAVGVGPRQR